MSWRDRLQPASWRGVPFHVEAHDDEFGRRGATHEYPGRDEPYHEDTGRAARKYAVTGFLIGDDYLDQLDRLLTAVEKPGAGELLHPWLGALRVCVDGGMRVTHRHDALGGCEFSVAFVEAGELRYPTRGRDTVQRLLDEADALTAVSAAALERQYELDGQPDFVAVGALDRALGLLGSVREAMDAVDQALRAPMDALLAEAGQWLSPGGDLGRFAASVSNLWSGVADLAGAPLRLQAQLKGMLAVAGLSSLRPQGLWPTMSSGARQVAVNRNAVAAYLRQSLLAEVVRRSADLPTITPPARQDRPAVDAADDRVPVIAVGNKELLALRAALSEAFDVEALRATDDATFTQLESTRVAAHADLSERASQAPRLITRTPPDVLPAVVLAALWQDDAGRAAELVARNGISHPGFVPVQPLKLLA